MLYLLFIFAFLWESEELVHRHSRGSRLMGSEKVLSDWPVSIDRFNKFELTQQTNALRRPLPILNPGTGDVENFQLIWDEEAHVVDHLVWGIRHAFVSVRSPKVCKLAS